MTVGEKIQFYRKKIGLSQEELGQKLLVSRQTVSLWEMDKTMPTVDNLVRLKEIFGVSVDRILSDSEETEEVCEETIKEKYEFEYSKPVLKELLRIFISPLLKKVIGSIVWSVLVFLLLDEWLKVDNIITSVFVGAFFIIIIGNIKSFVLYIKMWKKREPRLLESRCVYEIYDNYINITIYSDSEAKKRFKINISDIEKIYDHKKYFILQTLSDAFVVKKEDLNEDSFFYNYCNKKSQKGKYSDPERKLKTISLILFICTIASLWFGLYCVAALSAINKYFVENMWVFFVFIPIPIASIIFGYYLKNKGHKYLKNVIAGFIIAPLLCIYGSFVFMFSDTYSHSDEPILNAEELLDIDIPVHSQINTHDWTKGTQSVTRGYIYYKSEIYFDSTDVKEFEEHIVQDEKWITVLPNNMVGIISPIHDSNYYDYFIIYNVDEKTFNKLPEENGKYRFINVFYNSKSNEMEIVEYDMEYILD